MEHGCMARYVSTVGIVLHAPPVLKPLAHLIGEGEEEEEKGDRDRELFSLARSGSLSLSLSR